MLTYPPHVTHVLWIVTHQREVYYKHGIQYLDLPHKNNNRWKLSQMFTYPPREGNLPTQGWSPTKRKCATDLEFGT